MEQAAKAPVLRRMGLEQVQKLLCPNVSAQAMSAGSEQPTLRLLVQKAELLCTRPSSC